jgi:hypothetical protein
MLALAAVGIAAGVAGGVALTRYMDQMLFVSIRGRVAGSFNSRPLESNLETAAPGRERIRSAGSRRSSKDRRGGHHQ